jgi:ribosomal protein S18 acetylase RimI-like enzyme
MIAIRTATPEDAPRIAAITRAAYARWVPVIGREPLPMTVDYADAVTRHRFDCLCDGDTVVGLIETVREADALLVENVCVVPDRQGAGLGRRLMAQAEAIAAEAGLSRIRLYTNALFAANIALYGALGYRVAREEPFMGGTIVHMEKHLPAA